MSNEEVIKVLVVDDIAETRENIRKLLQFEADFEIVGAARNGHEGIELAKELQPDVILMDIQMPVMDGPTATKELRKRYSKEELPVIAMTAHAMSGDREKSLAAGMNAHITKPIVLNELFDTLAHWIVRH